MIIPNKIRIGGQDISVVIKERLDDNKLGTICVAEGVLNIADNFSNIKQCESSKINTFIHEVVHGVLDTRANLSCQVMRSSFLRSLHC